MTKPPTDRKERRRRLLKWLAVAAVAPAVLLFVGISLFVAQTEMAHDESRCPFVDGSIREVSEGISVREQTRSCQDGVEERRWLAVRQGQPPQELGRRRLLQERYDASYRWSARIEDSRVHVDVHNDGIDDASFQEPPPTD